MHDLLLFGEQLDIISVYYYIYTYIYKTFKLFIKNETLSIFSYNL